MGTTRHVKAILTLYSKLEKAGWFYFYFCWYTACPKKSSRILRVILSQKKFQNFEGDIGRLDFAQLFVIQVILDRLGQFGPLGTIALEIWFAAFFWDTLYASRWHCDLLKRLEAEQAFLHHSITICRAQWPNDFTKKVVGRFPQSKQDSWWGGYHMLSRLVTRLFLEFCNDKIGPRSSCETLWLQQFWQGWNLCDVCKNDFCHISSLIPKMQTWQNIFHYGEWVINLDKFSHLSVFHFKWIDECPFVVKPAQHFRRGQKCTLKSCKLLLQSPRSTSWICSWVLL